MKQKENVIASLLDLPDFEPERTWVEVTRLGLALELKELPYDRLMKLAKEEDADIHLILTCTVNHPELRDSAWYHDKMGCATPVDALKKLLRKGEVTKICRAIDMLHGYGPMSVVPLNADRQEAAANAATGAAVEELAKN